MTVVHVLCWTPFSFVYRILMYNRLQIIDCCVLLGSDGYLSVKANANTVYMYMQSQIMILGRKV